MSGIAGIYYPHSRSVDRKDLERMVTILAHRGPDGADMWVEGSTGFGHRMLWTTPESLEEKLPLVNRTGDLALTADARIDNRDELLAALDFSGCTGKVITDSQLILKAYEQWGERCPEKLLGDFAFAIWDRRKQVLFCTRDHMGVKPFYYYQSDRVFAFASEIKALLCLPEVPRRLNEVRVADYLVPILEDKVITFYKDILRLPPAHTMTVSRHGMSVRAYWSLDPMREIRYNSDAEYAEAFRDIFTEAVRCRLRSAFPLGSMLSGGLDSSSIVCVARKLLKENGHRGLHTFSAIFKDVPECDERPYINSVLAQGGLEPHYVHADQLSPLADLDRVFWHEDEPFYAPNLFMHWGLYRAAQNQGTRILLDGIDGDTTVSHSLVYLAELVRTGQWTKLTKEVNGLSKRFNRSHWRVLWHYGLSPHVPEPIRSVWRIVRGRNRPAWTRNAIVNTEFARQIGLAQRIQDLLRDRSKPAQTSREDHLRRLTSGMVPFALEVADKAAASFSLEPRYPFFDKILVEFCLALPPEQKLQRGWTRMVLRRAMTNILPVEVQWREGKMDLSPVLHRALLAFERELLEDVVLHDVKAIENYVDTVALRKAYQRYVSLGTDDSLTVWKVATLALWLRREDCLHLDQLDQKEGTALETNEKSKESMETKDLTEKRRRPYTAPQLTVHGTVEKITANIGTKGTDGLTGSTLV